jgi:hypothetical protein
MSMDRNNVAQSIEKRDFEGMRKHLINLVNKRDRKPVKALYFENFFFD